MTLKVYIGKTPVEKIFLGTSQLPKVALGNYKFTEGSKLRADFTTGTYKASGAAKTFEDLFTFSRAGKAWLVKETGLQEYAADVPRLDNGLLIEQAATNYFVNSIAQNPLLAGDLSASSFTEYSVKEQIASKGYNEVSITNGQLRQNVRIVSGVAHTLSMYLHGAEKSGAITSFPNEFIPATIVIDNSTPLSDGRFIYTQPVSNNTQISLRFGRSVSSLTGQTPFTVSRWQFERQDKASTFIKTTTSPATRPADFLLNKITGTTVTGDWDDTLNLSIVDGQLVHSGYGRIRSLEIN